MRQTILMRLIHYFVFIFIGTSTFAQNNSDTLSLSFEDKTIKEVILQIESASNYRFFFKEKWLGTETISRSYSDKSIEFILTDIFKETVLNFYIQDNQIILTQNILIRDRIPEPSDAVSKDTDDDVKSTPVFVDETEKERAVETDDELIKIGKEETIEKKKTYTISGFVRELGTNRPMANVAVSAQDTGIGTTTDVNGFYSIQLEAGSYVLITNSLNAKDSRKRIVVFNDGEINFNLEENIETLEEVLVEAEIDRNIKEVITGVTKIDIERIKNIPLVLGERDILKVAITLPGISTTGEGSNGYNVRGGKTDQNLIILDNAAIYNPSHFFGIFSAINPFTTGNAEIYKGNIPAEYGGRLSSVFDISTKDADTKDFKGEASIGPVTSNLIVEIPLVKEKSGLMLGGRSTYSGWILRALDDVSLKNSEASFFDVIGKYNHKINETNDIKATAYYSKDKFSITSDSIYGYSNRLFSLGWHHKFNDGFKSGLTVTNSEYQFDIEYDGDFNTDFDLNYKNNETEIKLKFDQKLSDQLALTYGLSSKLYAIFPGNFNPLNSDSDLVPINIQKERGLESAIFASAYLEFNDELGIDAGVRYSMFGFLGEGVQRIYEPGLPKSDATFIETQEFGKNEFIETFDGVEARLSARYFLTEDFSIKGSYNNTYQYIHTLSTNTTVSPTDTWKLSDKNIRPQRAQQFVLGLYRNFDDHNYEVSVEAYYKNYDDILDYKVGAQLLLNETLETQVLQGEGRSHGIEFLVKKNKGRFNGWIGYTYSKTELKLASEFAEETVNNGNYFPANYDKPHDFSAVINYKMTQRFSFSANFAYQTGRPITYPIGTYVFNNADFTLYSDRNKFRIPDYFRLDVGFNYEGNHKLKKIAHSFWNLSIYNVLGRNNPYSVYFVTENGQVKAYKNSIFSIPVPTVSFNFKF